MEINLKHNNGYCVICEKKATFIEHNDWLRDHYLCSTCNSIPRQRALIHALHTFFPKWNSYSIHESSPGGITTQLRPVPDVPRDDIADDSQSVPHGIAAGPDGVVR